MSDLIGRITVPSISASGSTFPLKTRWPHGSALKRPVVAHPFGSANAKIEQRFFLGTPAERYTFQQQLSRKDRNILRDFWDDMQGCIGSFVYPVPQEDGTFVNKNVCFENAPLTFEDVTNAISTVGLTFVELVDPAGAPAYAVASTLLRFPDSTLNTALLSQTQEIIPLVRIRVNEGAVDDIFLSDRRVTIGSQLYLPRLLRIGDEGSDVLISQSIPTDGNVPADDASFSFGNADRVMVSLANDTSLDWARIELSFFHVGTGIKLDFWAGYIVDWHADKGPEFQVKASDYLSALARSSPPGTITRQCGRRYGLDGCPAVPGSQVMDLVHFPSGDNTKCDLGYNTPNGCMAHQVQQSYQAVFTSPQGVLIIDKSNEGGGRLIRPTSIVSDTIYGDTLPEIYHDDEGVAQHGLPVKCKVAAGRDESDYFIALGLIGKGPIGALTAPQMWDQDGDGTPDTFLGSTLDGQPNHGFQVDATGHLKPGANASFGLRVVLGTDPAGAHDYFSLGRVANAGIGLGAARGWYTNPADGSPMYEEAYSGSAYNKVFAAGAAFVEIRRTDQGGIQPSLPDSHDMLAVISQGLSGYTWTAPGSRSLTGGITNPVWVAVNTHLRSLGLFNASGATQELFFDVDAAVAMAAVADTVAAKIFGSGTEKQFQFKGSIDQRRPTRDWLQFVLNSGAGFYTWSFGRLKPGCRYNASVVSAFTAGNIIWNSLVAEPVRPRFEKLTVKFNDQEYLYAANTVDYVDQDYAVRIGHWPAPFASDLDLPGTVTKSQAARLCVIRAREELGGVTEAEQRAARMVAFRTTLLALETEAGQVVSVADTDLPGGTGKFRILSWRLNRDFSVDITGKSVTDSMYDLTVGPKPADVAAAPIPNEGPAVWDPNYETPITNDPLFTAKSFGVRQVYKAQAGGVLASVDLFGDPPPDLSLYFKARRELVSGICAQVAASVATVDGTHGTIALGGSGLTVNGFVGRKVSKLANPSGSTALVPIQDFTVTANDAAGNFTVTPDPAAAGSIAGDLFTIRTSPTAADSTSFTDAKFINPYNTGGLTAGANRGNLALVIAGTGVGQPPRTVADNTTTKVTVTPAWSVTPDATSVVVLVEAIPQADLSPDFNLGAVDQFIGNFPIDNYSRTVVRIEGYTSQGAVAGRLEKAAFRELYLWGGAAPLTILFLGSGAQVGASFSAALRGSGGVPGYTYAVVSGSLPPGLSLNSSTGEITGTPATAGAYAFTGRVTDMLGTTADVSPTLSVASPSGGGSVTAISTVTGSDGGYGTDTGDLDNTRLVSFELDFTLTFPSTPTEYCTLYLSKDGGTTFEWVGWPFLYTSSSQSEHLTVLRPTIPQNWQIAAAPGTISGDPNDLILRASLPAGSVISANISIARLAKPSATGHNLSFTPRTGVGGNWPYNQTTTDESQYWSIPDFAVVENSGAYADPNIFVLTFTAQDYDAAGNPIGPEQVMLSHVPVNSVVDLGKLIGNYGTDGGSYVRADPYPAGTPSNLAFVRMRVIASNRIDQGANAWNEFVFTSTRQTDIAGGGADHVDVVVAVGGVPPPGRIVTTGIARSFAFSSFFDPSFEQATPGLVVDPSGALWGPGYFGSAVWLYDCPGPGVLTIYGSGGHNGGQYTGMRGASVRLGQLLTTTGGATHYFSVWAQSTNNSSVNHLLQFQAVWIDGSGSAISTTTVTVLSQYIPTWEFASGFVTAPAGAALVYFYYGTGSSEPSTDEWFIDDLYVQGTINQTGNDQTLTTAPAAGISDYSVMRALSTIDISNSYYGRQAVILTAPDGSIVSMTVGSGGGEITNDNGTSSMLIFSNGFAISEGTGIINFAVVSNVPQVGLQVSGVGYSGYNGTMSAAVAANKNIKAGFICN